MPEENTDQIPFADAEFALNAEPRCPCLLLLDTSSSMSGRPISELNDGLVTFRDELMADSLAVKRVEIAVVTFGPVQVASDFQTADVFQAPRLAARGDTPMGSAIEQGLEMLRKRKETYKQSGVSYYRPWVFLISDGEPTDAWQEAAARVHAEEQAHRVAFFAVGVGGANLSTLAQIATRQPVQLAGLQFREMFLWLSQSQKRVSASKVGEQTSLAPVGWGSV
jgi:uncharacterized protein YegL